MSLEKVIQLAYSQVGITEYPPNSNRVKYNTAYYGWDVKDTADAKFPWCVTFLWWVFNSGDERRAFFNGGKTASCTALKTLYQAEGRLFTDKGNYQKGDIALMNFNGGTSTDHCGLIVEVHEGYVKTIEGNTSERSSQDNGGMVCIKNRSPINIVAVCRPEYSSLEEAKIVTDYEDSWAKEEIEKVIASGIMIGDGKGNFRPGDNISRAEVATVVNRVIDYILKEVDNK